MLKGFIEVDIECCKGCELCVGACPPKIACLSISKQTNKKGYHYIEQIQNSCIGCGNCALICPDSVITVYRLKK
jgi:2-oxoglutarate ferredoxin oxidoreductase subunit delta